MLGENGLDSTSVLFNYSSSSNSSTSSSLSISFFSASWTYKSYCKFRSSIFDLSSLLFILDAKFIVFYNLELILFFFSNSSCNNLFLVASRCFSNSSSFSSFSISVTNSYSSSSALFQRKRFLANWVLMGSRYSAIWSFSFSRTAVFCRVSTSDFITQV